MLSNPIFRKWYIVIAFIFFTTGAFIQFLESNLNFTQKDYLEAEQLIENNLSAYYTNIEQDYEKLQSLDNDSFFKNRYSTSFLILNKEEIVFWTSNNLLTEDVNKLNEGYVELNNGKFIIDKKTLNKNEGVTVVFFLELFKKYPLQNQYLSNTWNSKVFGDYQQISTYPVDKNKSGTVVNLDNEAIFQFSLINPDIETKLPYYLYVLGIVFLSISVINGLNKLLEKGTEILSVLLFITYLIIIKIILQLTGIFPNILKLEVFTAGFYSPSILSSSFGDLLLNLVLFFSGFYYMYYVFFRKNEIKVLRSVKAEPALFILALLSSGCFYFLHIFHFVLENIYTHSTLNFDVTKNVNLDKYEFTYITIFVLFSLSYLLLSRIFLKIATFFSQSSFKSFLFVLSSGAVLYIVPGLFFGYVNWLLCLVNLIYLLVCFRYGIYKHIKKFRFYSYIYMILTASVCAFIGAQTITKYSLEEDKKFQKEFAENLVINDDLEAEYLLDQINNKIIHDLPGFQFSGEDTVQVVQAIKNKIYQSYLEHYFEQFEVSVYFFDEGGKPVNYQQQNALDYLEYKSRFANPKYQTKFKNLYFINFYDHGDYSKYISLIELPNSVNLVNHIVIELVSDKLSPNSVYPRLLGDRKINTGRYFDDFSYSVFSNGKLLFSSGNYNYRFWEIEPYLKETDQYYFSYEEEGIRHLVYQGVDNKVVVVSVEDNTLFTLFTNYSFLLLILIFCIILSFIVYIGFANAFNSIPSYSTRIHLYLNFIYLLAIVSISVVTLKWVTVEYERELKNNFRIEAEEIGRHTIQYLEKYEEEELSFLELNHSLKRLASYSGTDLNLYNPEGKLIFTSQPLIYNNGLVSNLMNPAVVRSIFYQKHKIADLNEGLGSFNYHNVYLSLSSYNDDHLLGVLSIPFLDSVDELQSRKVDLVNAILNVFTLVFILVLFISYVAFINITRPLRSISQKIKETSLTGNQFIEWKAEDEIGLIVNEYNRMINKLEESKLQFEQSKKEDAWKEMARQVAHEIKNPLTPMSLKLQQLKRVSDPGDTRLHETLDALLLQVDTLSDIATSFSTFSKMPDTEFEKFDLVMLLSDTLRLFEGEEMQIIRNYEHDPVFVFADRKLLGRVINNLVLNAVQSVANSVKPLVIVDLTKVDGKVRLSISDNGEGIPDEIKAKVFQPNFSTKYTGSGIGLAVAKKAIEQANGQIWFDSTPGKGTEFYIELPVIK